MKKDLCLLIILGVILTLSSLEIIDTKGISHYYDNAELYKKEMQEIKTTREKDGTVRLNTWQGFRFDIWLKQQKLGDFATIRLESSDRYQVTLEKAEFDSLESYIVTGQDGVPFEENMLRLIFPALREMQWIKGLERVVLENFQPLIRPRRFYLMQEALKKYPLQQDPKPFVKTQGWFLSDILMDLSEAEEKQVILYSRDGLKQHLTYPLHLEGAILEKTAEGHYNLKSPQIPGGMWMKDVIYLQCDNYALISDDAINQFIPLAKTLHWETTQEMQFRIVFEDGEEVMNFTDALAEPQVFKGALFIELF
ncbi:MAG TPA: hypothetical protein PLE33_05360 [Candidatus Cloacimonas sp.]|nr:hypothetical protein [Candidatus Cloacimonas sp.]HPS60672.1 hypothetical protein [Candidatus Cloacimonas sp.]